jgi:hypothetical protein
MTDFSGHTEIDAAEIRHDRPIADISDLDILCPQDLIRKPRGSQGEAIEVHQYDLKTGRYMASYPSTMKAAAAVGITNNNISRATRRAQKTAGGYAWRTYKRDSIDVGEWIAYKEAQNESV